MNQVAVDDDDTESVCVFFFFTKRRDNLRLDPVHASTSPTLSLPQVDSRVKMLKGSLFI